ncbi:hypothetical protein GPL17_18765 [Bradyrhizobium yuanmingense]|uniref:hypothetical protein n=1 Tax=Bradyrhizobium yuanmingense TaxID=108015 RepID=UPI0012FAF4E7|nr:hypothetical protein [Bradyrhizobium yuanmingense]MVT52526.1 hypothetical protein [Bradyrhizobium yuanmingense]
MTEELSPSFNGVEFPSFVRFSADEPKGKLNFWDPDRSGPDKDAYSAGFDHFRAALAFAHASHAEMFLPHVVKWISFAGCGDMERGFIDALAAAAAVGRRPPILRDAVIDLTEAATGISAEELRYGESEAIEYLELAQACRSPDLVASLLVDIANYQFGHGALTFMTTVCRAAYAGGAN